MLQERKRDITYFVEHPVYSNFKVDRIMAPVSWFLILFILLILKIHFNLSISAQIPSKNVNYS